MRQLLMRLGLMALGALLLWPALYLARLAFDPATGSLIGGAEFLAGFVFIGGTIVCWVEATS